MKYIKYDGIRIYYDFKLLFNGFLAITLFGRVYCRLSKSRLYYWFINLFKYGFNKHAYYNIPFEREAYSNQDNFSYIKDGLVDWKKYKK